MEALFDFADPEYGAAVQAGYQSFVASALSNFSDCCGDYTMLQRFGKAVAGDLGD
jgi:hypothetical protein